MNTTTATDLTQVEARELTDTIKSNLDSLSTHIFRAMTGRAYLALGYTSVQEWAGAEFGLGRSRVYQLCSWKLAERKLIEACHLAEDWSVLEGHLRDFTSGSTFPALVSEAVKLIEGVEDQGKRGAVVTALVLRKKRLLNDSKAKAKTSKAVAMESTGLGKALTKAVEPAAALPSNDSLAYLWVKAQDSATAITVMEGPEEPEVKQALTTAASAFRALLAKLEAGESK